jgi:DNA-binding MarR family transcriptional regulator
LGATVPDWIQLELPIGQVKTLMALAGHERLNVSALAELLRIGKPAASILVDRLVQQAYVARTEDPEDRRRTLLALTPAGSDLVATLRQGAGESRFARWLEQMDEGDLAALTRGLQALATIAAREGASAAPPPCAPR